MDTELRDNLERRHAYESWQNRNALSENLFVWRFFLSGNEIPGWQAHRIQAVEAAGWPPGIQSIWHQPPAETETLLRVDVFECASRADAHAFLIQLLGEFQSPLIGRRTEGAIGDVAFSHPGDAGLLFARANLVLLIQNAGRELVAVDDVARRIDSELIIRPDRREVRVVPEIRRFEVAAAQGAAREGVLLEVEAADPLDRPLWYKFFSPSGEVLLAEGRLIYRAAASGPQEVTVYALNANGGAARQTVQFDVNQAGASG